MSMYHEGQRHLQDRYRGRAVAEHRVRINLPHGIEFDLAEIGSGTTKTMASVALDLRDTYCDFTRLRQSGKGVVRSR